MKSVPEPDELFFEQTRSNYADVEIQKTNHSVMDLIPMQDSPIYPVLLTPLDGFAVFISGNFNLQDFGDRDSDLYLF